MDCKGTILKVNKAFTKNYGYTTQDLEGRYFNILYNENDKKESKSEIE
jgi:PAS domain S-box